MGDAKYGVSGKFASPKSWRRLKAPAIVLGRKSGLISSLTPKYHGLDWNSDKTVRKGLKLLRKCFFRIGDRLAKLTSFAKSYPRRSAAAPCPAAACAAWRACRRIALRCFRRA